jgi:hypothetical protein
MIGNARIDRVGFAYSAGKENGKEQIYIRITGRGDHQRIVAGLKVAAKEAQANNRTAWKESKDAKGTPITTMNDQFGPALAFIGDTDLLLAFYASALGGAQDKNHLELIDKQLAVRAGKEKSVLKSAVLDRQPKLAPAAVGLLVGDLPEQLRRNPFQNANLPGPKSVRIEVLRAREGVDVCFRAALENPEEAKNFVQTLGGLRTTGLVALKTLQDGAKDDGLLPRSAVASLSKALESLKLQPDGAAVKGTISVPSEALLTPLLLQLRVLGVGAEPPQPRPVDRGSS